MSVPRFGQRTQIAVGSAKEVLISILHIVVVLMVVVVVVKVVTVIAF